MKFYLQKLYRRPAFVLAVLAGLLYCSWPLAFVLNPGVARSLASQLEAPNQPYNWVFIAGDVLTGVVLLAVGVIQFKALRLGRLVRWSMAGYAIFGLLSAVAALLPLNCDPQARTCGQIIANPLLILHGAASIISVLALLMSVILLGLYSYYQQSSPLARQIFRALLVSWLLFGVGSVLEFWYHPGGNASQDYFITLCSVSVVAVVGAIEYLVNKLGVVGNKAVLAWDEPEYPNTERNDQ